MRKAKSKALNMAIRLSKSVYWGESEQIEPCLGVIDE
jgi:hypothetical protein